MNKNIIPISPESFIPDYSGIAGVFLCTSGTADVIINGQAYTLDSGMLYIISPLIRICILSQSDDFGGIHITDEFAVFYPVVRSLIGTLVHLRPMEKPCFRLEADDMLLIIRKEREIGEKLAQIKETTGEEERKIILRIAQTMKQAVLLETLHMRLRNTTFEATPTKRSESIAYDFFYALHTNKQREKSVTFYANEARLSPSYFKSVIKSCTGRTPSEWIALIIMEQAKTLLQKTQKSIKEISSELNFPDQFTFNKYFKRHAGMPPSAFRRQHLSAHHGTRKTGQS